MASSNMKAVNYQGPFKVKVEEVPMPKLEHPDDIIVKVTTVSKLVLISRSTKVHCLIGRQAAICGSDLQ